MGKEQREAARIALNEQSCDRSAIAAIALALFDVADAIREHSKLQQETAEKSANAVGEALESMGKLGEIFDLPQGIGEDN